ncbi:MAG: AI-2E family transporter [Syntrophobacteraceae bacterium]|jgi:predicted PurR-regulated permease PerM
MKMDECGRHKLDEMVDCIRNESGLEGKWENQPNTLLENHPYLVGYSFLIGLAVTFTVSHLMVFAISFLFLFFISDFMTRDVHRIAPFVPKALLFSVLYILVIWAIILLTYKVIPMMLKNFPELSTQLQVQIVKELKAAGQEWNLTEYIDIDELKGSILKASSGILQFLANSLTPLYKGLIEFVFALAINLFFYFESEKVEQAFTRNPNSLMTFVFKFIQMRLRIFYIYFRRVMGGQVIIALINTMISTVVIFALDLHHPFLMIFVVFFCGLFPVVGNLMSNSVLTINAFVSTGMWGTVACLIMLVGIHKLEYILNSRVIGGIVHLPMAVSLGSLIFCEVLLGIPGLILAIPLALFVRHEFEHIRGFPGSLPEEAGEQVRAAVGGDSAGGWVSEEQEEKGRPVSKIK